MLFVQMRIKPDNENQEIYFTGEDDNTPITSATQTLDLLALHLPPEKLIPHLVNISSKRTSPASREEIEPF